MKRYVYKVIYWVWGIDIVIFGLIEIFKCLFFINYKSCFKCLNIELVFVWGSSSK